MSCDALQRRHRTRMWPRGRPRRQLLAGQEKSGAFGTGCGDGHVTPKRVLHSNFGCCIGTRSKSATYEIPFATGAPEQRSPLLNTKERQKPKQLKKNLRRRTPHGPFGYVVTFSPDRATPTNDLRPADTGWGSGPSDRTSPLSALTGCLQLLSLFGRNA